MPLLLGVVEKRRSTSTPLRLFVMSATLDDGLFKEYFKDAPKWEVEGRTQPVTISYITQEALDRAESLEALAADTIVKLHLKEGPGDILCFAEGKDMCKKIVDCAKRMIEDQDLPDNETAILDFDILHGSSTKDEEAKALAPPPLSNNSHPGRRCIVATNVAETSITIPGVVWVVDTGKHKEAMYDQRQNLYRLESVPISQDAARQRAGRAGRVKPGYCYRLYTQQLHDECMPEHTTAAITSANTMITTLQLLKLGENPITFNFMESFASEMLVHSYEQLYKLKMITSKLVVTTAGLQTLELMVAPHLAATLFKSEELGCISEILTIVACVECLEDGKDKLWLDLSSHKIPEDRKSRQHAKQNELRQADGDHLTYLATYSDCARELYKSEAQARSWCSQHGLDFRTLLKIRNRRIQLVETWQLHHDGELITNLDHQNPFYNCIIIKCLVAGHFMQTAFKTSVGKNTFQVTRNHNVNGELVDRTLGGTPETSRLIIFNRVTRRGNKDYFSAVTRVKLEHLIEAAPRYFDPSEHLPGPFRNILLDKWMEMTGMSRDELDPVW